MQDLALLRLLVVQQQIGIDSRVVLAVNVEDLRGGEDRVQTERTSLIRNDRHDAVAELLITQQILEQTDERHRRRHLLLTGTSLEHVPVLLIRHRDALLNDATLGQVATELAALLVHVLKRRVLRRGLEVRSLVRIVELIIRDVELEGVAQKLQIVRVELLHLVGRVTTSEVRAERVALNRVGEDDGRLTLMLGRRLVGRVHLAVVVTAAVERPDLLIRPVGNHGLGARIAAEEVLAHVRAVVRLEGLVIAVDGLVHQVDERAVLIGLQQLIPLAAPHDLNDVPTSTLERCLELLDDLAITAHRPVKTLQVRVDDEGQVVEVLASR